MFQVSNYSSDNSHDYYSFEYYYNENDNNMTDKHFFVDEYDGYNIVSVSNQSIYLALLNIGYFILMVIGMVGNVIVIRLVNKEIGLPSISNYLIANLAFADILLIIVTYPLPIDMEEYQFLHHIHRFCELTLLFLSSGTMITLFYERYQTVRGSPPISLQGRELISLLWLFSSIMGLNFSLLFTIGTIHHQHAQYFNSVFFIVYFMLPLILVVSLFVLIEYYARVKGTEYCAPKTTVLQCPDSHIIYALTAIATFYGILKSIHFIIKMKILLNFFFFLFNFTALVNYHYANEFVIFCYHCLKPIIYCAFSKELRDIFISLPFLCCNFLMRITKLGRQEPIFI